MRLLRVAAIALALLWFAPGCVKQIDPSLAVYVAERHIESLGELREAIEASQMRRVYKDAMKTAATRTYVEYLSGGASPQEALRGALADYVGALQEGGLVIVRTN